MVMRRAVVLAFVSTFAVASVALAATGAKAPHSTLAQAVDHTNRAPTMRYAMAITVLRTAQPSMTLRVQGERGHGSLFIHVRALSDTIPGPQQSALLDGPFLYEGSPNGVAITGKVRWLRLPVARIGAQARPIETIHNFSPAPLLRVLDEWRHAKTRSANGVFDGTVAYDDAIVQTALTSMAGGIQFRDVRFSAHIGNDGYVHDVRITGRTPDGQRTLLIIAHLYAFGRPVTPRIPGEGTFMDQKLVGLAE